MQIPTTIYPDFYELGYLRKTHGIKGDLVAILDTDEPNRYAKMKSVWLELGAAPQEFKVTKVNVLEKDKSAIIHLEGVDDINDAEKYLRTRIFLPLSNLPQLTGKKFYYHEIIGFQLIDLKEGAIGPVTEVYDLLQHPVGEAEWEGKKILFPLIPDFIVEIDREGKILKMDLPDGMLEVYR